MKATRVSGTAPGVTTFRSATTVVSGFGSLSGLPDHFAALGAERVAVIADRGVAEAGLLARVLGPDGRIPVRTTQLIAPNPDVAATEAAASAARRAGCDAVLAVGGGSALGAAKAVAIRITNDQPITAYEGSGRVTTRPAPTVAVPTTAGSGSEVSNALVLHEPGRDREIIVRGPGCEPAVALLDGAVLRDLPRTPMLYAALDALTHAMEALWARGGGTVTDALASAAADRILTVLPRALEDRDDDALQLLLEASCMANLACGNSGLGLVHALSAAPDIKLPHGYQNGALLPYVARFNEQVLATEHRPLVHRIAALYDSVGFAGRFDGGELTAHHGRAMVRATQDHPFRLNNRRPSTDEDLFSILHEAGIMNEERS
ncbi:iron-containing alcohol dehydrogenase [Streptomyces sp. NPDC005813]|uniref:iron-containing alcohol dehydrogenase family protein n=1 Tax=Streptomyces sp. NPDC005813 TaxID=3155592 RepID=UPI0033FFCD83